ncbi:MAG: LysM peptidoglycan-binding domain-containing protein [bacterium]
MRNILKENRIDYCMERIPYKIFFSLFIAAFIVSGCFSQRAIKSPEEEFFHPIFSTVESIDPNLLLPNEGTPPINAPGMLGEEIKQSEGQEETKTGEQRLLDDPNKFSPPLLLSNNSHGEIYKADNGQNDLDEALRLCQEAQTIWRQGFPEKALEKLDTANKLLVEVDSVNDPTLMQEKDDIRFLISKRIVEIYASRQTMVNGNHNEIPCVINQYVETEIEYFLGKEKTSFLQAYERSGRYRRMILSKLKEAGLPAELSWLPLIESNFNEKAFSKARALGLWQFIPSTGYKFGLVRDNWIDERMDPEKSTIAAIEYLTQLHKIFGEWTTALAAYNCGERKVLEIIRTQHINYLDNFWDLFEKLPRETARYVPRFIAVLHIIEDPKKYGIELGTPADPVQYEETKINKQISFKDLAAKIDIDIKILISLNPELRYNVTPNYRYLLKVPIGFGDTVTAAVDTILPWEPRYVDYKYHRVKKGETLSEIAENRRISLQTLIKINHIHNPDQLSVGQRLKIPYRSKRRISQTSHRQRIEREKYKKYIVQKGDNPSKIAETHNMDLDKFIRINRLTKSSIIYPGQIVLIE